MQIEKLKLNNFRNFDLKEIIFSENLNIVRGKNASGKTSILEAINLTSSAKSFRTNSLNSMIKNDQEFLNAKIFFQNDLKIKEDILFIREKTKKTEGRNSIFLREKKISISDAAQKLPIQVINQDDFNILDGSPSLRRKFLDWGVFHVKHNFYEYWKKYSIVLKQRNALLKQKKIDEKILQILDDQMISLALELNELRKNYLDIYKESLQERLKDWYFLKKIQIKFFSGWDEKRDFKEVLQKNKKRDMDLGLTTAGPHRCDLRFEIENTNIVDFLSRGQQKIFVIILKISQGDFLKKTKNTNCVYLIDDLYAELDKENFLKILNILSNLDNQIILTMKEKLDFSFEKMSEIIL